MPGPDDMRETKLRRQLAETARELGARGLNRGASGNSSVRCAGGFLITPSGVAAHLVTPESLVFVTMDGEAQGDLRPSSEWRMHRDIYAARADAGAVIHTHSDNATALACLERPIPPFHYMVAMAGGSLIDCAPYARFGTAELSEAMLKGLGSRRATLLAHHGMICYDEDLATALALAEEVEGLARQYLLACSAGRPKNLSDAQMAAVLKAFATYGQPQEA